MSDDDASPAPATFDACVNAFRTALAKLPDAVPLPYELTEEGQRLTEFRRVCPVEFYQKIDRSKLRNPTAFDRVAQWNGSFPGPCAVGSTSTGKTRAAWSALGRLYVHERRDFYHFTADELMSQLKHYNELGAPKEFHRRFRLYRALFIDDVDKLNWQFESNHQVLFAFYDWIYRDQIPCLTTTNKPRAWWGKQMGDAFARRLCDDAQTLVNFG